MDMVQLGNTDLKVSRLGVGLVEIGLQLTENDKDQAYAFMLKKGKELGLGK